MNNQLDWIEISFSSFIEFSSLSFLSPIFPYQIWDDGDSHLIIGTGVIVYLSAHFVDQIPIDGINPGEMISHSSFLFFFILV